MYLKAICLIQIRILSTWQLSTHQTHQYCHNICMSQSLVKTSPRNSDKKSRCVSAFKLWKSFNHLLCVWKLLLAHLLDQMFIGKVSISLAQTLRPTIGQAVKVGERWKRMLHTFSPHKERLIWNNSFNFGPLETQTVQSYFP